MSIYSIVHALLILLYRGLTRLRVAGLENVPREGPLLVIANHLSLADPPLVGISLERRISIMAKQELFRFSPFGYFLGELSAFPVHRGKLDLKAMRQVYQLLESGAALLVFPEGSRSRTGKMNPAFMGAAQIAVRANVPILPVAVSGTEALERPLGLLRRPEIKLNIGQPFHLPKVDGRASRQELEHFTVLMMRSIAALLPQSYRGEYGHTN